MKGTTNRLFSLDRNPPNNYFNSCGYLMVAIMYCSEYGLNISNSHGQVKYPLMVLCYESSVGLCGNDLCVYQSMNDLFYTVTPTVTTNMFVLSGKQIVVRRFYNIGPEMYSVVSTFAVLVATVVFIDADRKNILY